MCERILKKKTLEIYKSLYDDKHKQKRVAQSKMFFLTTHLKLIPL